VTKLPEQAIAIIRDLPDSQQHEVAEVLLSMASRNRGPLVIDEETRNAIAEGGEQARRVALAEEAEMAAFIPRNR
jgi:hypothetical protein